VDGKACLVIIDKDCDGVLVVISDDKSAVALIYSLGMLERLTWSASLQTRCLLDLSSGRLMLLPCRLTRPVLRTVKCCGGDGRSVVTSGRGLLSTKISVPACGSTVPSRSHVTWGNVTEALNRPRSLQANDGDAKGLEILNTQRIVSIETWRERPRRTSSWLREVLRAP